MDNFITYITLLFALAKAKFKIFLLRAERSLINPLFNCAMELPLVGKHIKKYYFNLLCKRQMKSGYVKMKI